MDLIKTINTARRCRASLTNTFLILALIETDACNTPFFAGLEGDELVISLLTFITLKEREFIQKYMHEYDKNDFFGFLLSTKELDVNLSKLMEVFDEIRKMGEEHYEFKRFDELDTGYAE